MTASKQGQDGPDPAWKRLSNLQEIYQCQMYSRKPLMMGKANARNMWSFFDKIKFGKFVRLVDFIKNKYSEDYDILILNKTL